MRRQNWQDSSRGALAGISNPKILASLSTLEEGHERFLAQTSQHRTYSEPELREISQNQRPIAAVVGCSDSRVTPEVIFDQPLGQIFASRVPGNVASDSAKWMLDIAVTELHVPLVIVLGHTGCLAVGQIVDGRVSSAGGSLRFDVQKAVHRARMSGDEDVRTRAVIENVRLTLENLHRDSFAVQRAVERNDLALVGAYYEMDTGVVHLI